MIELLLEAERALSSGQVDRAEQLYRQVADADPHNSIAVVGLARVALERGDELGAYLLARRALTIDPENDAARRLAGRLEDGLASRGEPVAEPMGPEALAVAPTQTESDAPPAPRTAATAETAAPVEAVVTAAPRRRSLLDRLRRR